ncbi:MAG: dephospho-CoA kinase [Candidatus Omnitrophica bacterium CG11_big_fil_rev_8_21_14_0_20_63_9]|nr:MAG: dephospho-CoA kinase [Candidatus Omnitrophica bacterium CG11_big_fil_rev_8_21_14_0_20_63_9]
MVVIGVTGGIGTGKSTVAGMFKQLGAVVLDADVIARQVMEPKRLAWRQIVKAFGEEILNQDETIDRQRLAEVVFHDPQRRAQLERIIHPQVLRTMREQVQRLRKSRRVKTVVLDVPLLLEAGAQRGVDAVVVVTATPEVQRQRLKRKFGWTDEDIDARVHAQWALSAKVALADHVVDNADGVEHTRTQVKQLWNKLGLSSRSSTSRR